MLQSNHRNASFVHAHSAVLQFAFFFLTKKTWRTKVYDKKQPDASVLLKRPAELCSIVS